MGSVCSSKREVSLLEGGDAGPEPRHEAGGGAGTAASPNAGSTDQSRALIGSSSSPNLLDGRRAQSRSAGARPGTSSQKEEKPLKSAMKQTPSPGQPTTRREILSRRTRSHEEKRERKRSWKSGDAKGTPPPQPKRRTGNEDGVGPSPGEKSPRTRRRLVRRSSHRGMLNHLALQFPSIRRSFVRVQEAVRQFSAPTKRKAKTQELHITSDKLGALLEHVARRPFEDQEVRDLFSVADLDGSKTIEFREFLVAVAIGYFLKHESTDSDHKEIQKGFRAVEKAFKDIDDDGSNTVDADELKKALFATGGNSSEQPVLEARFKELDINGDGEVSFPEFLYGFSQWVGFEEDDDEPIITDA